MSDHPSLRERLVEMRSGLLAGMDRQIEAGSLTLLAGINAALAALDVEAVVTGECAGRAVVSDTGSEIRLALYRDDGEAVAVVLDPVRALHLAERLIAAALPKLP
jgi:hypothetical protein